MSESTTEPAGADPRDDARRDQAATSRPAAEPAPADPTAIGKSPDVTKLPHYARSLLKVRLPVSVQLAAKRETVQEIVSMAPGSIIKFEKGCDELLQMAVGDQLLAEGEAVKIGDKFGFRVTNILLPREHFVTVRRPRRERPA